MARTPPRCSSAWSSRAPSAPRSKRSASSRSPLTFALVSTAACTTRVTSGTSLPFAPGTGRRSTSSRTASSSFARTWAAYRSSFRTGAPFGGARWCSGASANRRRSSWSSNPTRSSMTCAARRTPACMNFGRRLSATPRTSSFAWLSVESGQFASTPTGGDSEHDPSRGARSSTTRTPMRATGPGAPGLSFPRRRHSSLRSQCSPTCTSRRRSTLGRSITFGPPSWPGGTTYRRPTPRLMRSLPTPRPASTRPSAVRATGRRLPLATLQATTCAVGTPRARKPRPSAHGGRRARSTPSPT